MNNVTCDVQGATGYVLTCGVRRADVLTCDVRGGTCSDVGRAASDVLARAGVQRGTWLPTCHVRRATCDACPAWPR